MHAIFVRSPIAHARILDVDTTNALEMPGVLGVFAAATLGLTERMPNLYPAPPLAGSKQASPLAVSEVGYVGEPVVVVVAGTRPQGLDAAERVFVDYDLLDPVVDHATALDPETPLAHLGLESNLVATLATRYGDVDAAFSGAHEVVAVHLQQHRGACAAMEPRGVLAHRDAALGQLLVWSSTQDRKSVV